MSNSLKRSKLSGKRTPQSIRRERVQVERMVRRQNKMSLRNHYADGTFELYDLDRTRYYGWSVTPEGNPRQTYRIDTLFKAARRALGRNEFPVYQRIRVEILDILGK